MNKDGLKLNGSHQLLVYADDVVLLGGKGYAINKNTETCLVVSMEIGLELNTDKT